MRTKVNLALALMFSLIQGILFLLISWRTKEGGYLFAKFVIGLNPLLLCLIRTTKEEKFKRRTEVNYEENIDEYFRLKRVSTFKNRLRFWKLALPTPITKDKV